MAGEREAFFLNNVWMSTQAFRRFSLSVSPPDEIPIELDRPAGEKIANEKGLVPGKARHEIAVARMEY